MLKIIALAVGIGLLVYVAVTWTTVASLPASQFALDLKVKSQAEVGIAVAGLSSRLKLAMAGGPNDVITQRTLREDLASLHQMVDDSRTRLTTLGDTPAQVDQWLESIHWADLVALEADWLKTLPANGPRDAAP